MVTPGFLAASLLVVMMPGPDLALISRLALTHRRSGPAVAAAFGMVTAGAGQAALGASGLAALLAAQPALFTAFRWAGAGVLIAMAALALRSALRPAGPLAGSPTDAGTDPPAGRAFWLGLACSGTNPKVGLFLMAFLPQFVPPGAEPVSAVALLAAVHLGLGLTWLLIWTAAAHRLASSVHGPSVARATDGLTAVAFTYFGVRLFLG